MADEIRKQGKENIDLFIRWSVNTHKTERKMIAFKWSTFSIWAAWENICQQEVFREKKI